MKVKELIKKLKKLPPEDEVQIWGSINDDGEGWIKTPSGEINNLEE